MMDLSERRLDPELKELNPAPRQNRNEEQQTIRASNSVPIRAEGRCYRRLLKLAGFVPFFSSAFKDRRLAIVKRSGGRLKAKAAADPLPAWPKDFRGFSLVETLIAMAIVFFLLVGLAQMLCYSLLLKQKGDLHQVSADLVSRKLELLKSLEGENEALSPGIHQETIQDYNSGRLFLLTWEVSESQSDLKKILVSLYPAPFGSRPPVRACWLRSESLGF